jgi:hypothetical protein
MIQYPVDDNFNEIQYPINESFDERYSIRKELSETTALIKMSRMMVVKDSLDEQHLLRVLK